MLVELIPSSTGGIVIEIEENGTNLRDVEEMTQAFHLICANKVSCKYLLMIDGRKLLDSFSN